MSTAITAAPAPAAKPWTAPRPIGRACYPTVHLFLPPASAHLAIRRVIEQLNGGSGDPQAEGGAAALYRYFDRDGGLHGTDPRQPLRAHGSLYHWWFEAATLEQLARKAGIADDALPAVVVLRDPRDALISLYHLTFDPLHLELVGPAQREAQLAYRRQIESLSLDEYVLQTAPWWTERLQELASWVERSRSPLCWVSYALLCHAFPQFLDQLARFLRLVPAAALRDHLLRTEDVKLRASLHPQSLAQARRASPMPGRFRRELQPATIEPLNRLTRPLRQWISAREPPALRALYDD